MFDSCSGFQYGGGIVVGFVVDFLGFLILGFVTVYGYVLVVADLRSKREGRKSRRERKKRQSLTVYVRERERERGRKSLTGGLTVLGTKLGIWTNLISFKMS